MCRTVRPLSLTLDVDSHCPIAAGSAKVASGGRWPNSNHGVCGDAIDSNQRWAQPSSGPYPVYTEGQVLDIDISITAQHDGRHSFAVCDIKDQTNECFGNPANLLER